MSNTFPNFDLTYIFLPLVMKKTLCWNPAFHAKEFVLLVQEEYQTSIFNFYLGMIEDFKTLILFTDFEPDLLKILNIAPSQLHSNGWGFIKFFEIVYEAMDIILTLSLFFSFLN